jgi:NitT/TauT family transport system permease protein
MGTNLAPRRTAEEIAGLDALDLGGRSTTSRAEKMWSAVWPKLAAIGLALGLWQLVVLSGWKDEWILPGPVTVFDELIRLAPTGEFWDAVGTTSRRAVAGFACATVLGLLLGVAVARSRVLRTALGSFITGLQTMPSIAWFPLAIVLFQLSEEAMFFVVVLGAAPSIANGVITGVDFVSPVLVRAGRNLGARGLALYRYVIGPASLPAIIAGLKQGWAFAWRSLMAGELLVQIPNAPSIGANLSHSRDQTDYAGMIAYMIVILVFGILIDVLFNAANNRIRRRWGLADAGH